ncbi:MAG: endolytic transglycosylase MltG [Chitinophagales bacterium]
MNRKKIFFISAGIFLLVVVILGFSFYKKLFTPNVVIGEKDTFIFIPTGSDVAGIATMLKAEGVIENVNTFLWVADKKNYGKNIIPGKYKITNGMGNNELINLLRSGKQTPVNVTFNNVRTFPDLAGKVAKHLETDSSQFVHYFDTTTYFASLGLKKEQAMTLLLPDTYEFKWNTSPLQFMQRMKREHDIFWNENRKQLLKNIKLTEQQAYTLASIVYAETKKSDEATRIAGVYKNRLSQKIPLQADPTVVFAIGDFTKTRVTYEDLQFESPYNTYKNQGLPPGPICMPPKKYIDAVLNYERHDYIYFCAKEDLSGYSNFAKTLDEHNRNARKYQEAYKIWLRKKTSEN